MRQIIKDFVSIASRAFPIDQPIWEFGSLQVPGQEGFADLRPLFPGTEYFGADMREGPGVDKMLNLHEIDLPAESVGTVLCLDTLEHVEYPHRALEEIHRILKPNGIAIISSVMDFPIHDFPYDYWRFTPEAFRSILRPFAASFVGFAGGKSLPHTVVAVGFKASAPLLSEFARMYEQWQRPYEEPTSNRIVKLLTPPLFLPAFSRVYNAMYRQRRRLLSGRLADPPASRG